MSDMRRRKFITLLGSAAAAWPLAARAQQTTKSRKVGLLHSGESTVVNMRVAAIREGLNGPEHQRAGVRGAACGRYRGGVLCARPLAHAGRVAAVVATSCGQSTIDRRPRDPKKSSDDLPVPRDCKSGWAARLWAGHPGSFSSGRSDGA